MNRSDQADLTTHERVSLYVDMWRQSVETQQHFNTIEWQIRGLALTVATFALGAAGWVAKDGSSIGPVSVGSVAAFAGLILWYAFYFVDRHWYHPLLKGAVAHGTQLENEIKKDLPQVGMTATITDHSAYTPGRLVRWLNFLPEGEPMHSDHKLTWFYRVGALALALTAVGLQIATLVAPASTSPQHIVVTISRDPTPSPTP